MEEKMVPRARHTLAPNRWGKTDKEKKEKKNKKGKANRKESEHIKTTII